jgi:aryl-alcohol dehydrogenase-like predicted oxidoreductase
MSSSVTNHSRYLSSHLDEARALPNQVVMKKRPLGATGLMVGEIGLGTAELGSEHIPDHEAIYTIGSSVDMEAALIDVAPTYGRALHRVGLALKGRRQQAEIALKAGYYADGHSDYSPKGLRKSVDQSLGALSTGHADVVLLHNPPATVYNAADPVWAELAKLKAEGKTRAFGISLTTADEAKAALDKTPAQVLELPFSAFFQDHAANFDAAQKKQVGLIANRCLDSGWLSGRYGAHHVFFDARRRWSMADKARRAALQEQFETIVASPTGRPAQAALQFVLSHGAISCALAGATQWQQVIGNVSAIQDSLAPAALLKLRELWDKQLKTAPLGL